ncbi:hypothetical protein L596_023838 [Steinernema carpocapsae]|uniref:Uncharacterized protein n=1 Tax=Steinernema carpocapsae TaxID=34508 RepID=A0A4U5MEY1_STECR|nr:hypothetical protein L596_023838 [Steinernema carpocapsae]
MDAFLEKSKRSSEKCRKFETFRLQLRPFDAVLEQGIEEQGTLQAIDPSIHRSPRFLFSSTLRRTQMPSTRSRRSVSASRPYRKGRPLLVGVILRNLLNLKRSVVSVHRFAIRCQRYR